MKKKKSIAICFVAGVMVGMFFAGANIARGSFNESSVMSAKVEFAPESEVYEILPDETDTLLDLNLSSEVTLYNGFQIINGNIHDRDGNLFISLNDNGFTNWGTRLSSDFKIIYASDVMEDQNKAGFSYSELFDIFNGTKELDQNIDGTQAIALGESFKFSSNEQLIRVKYSSGNTNGVNFGLANATSNVEHLWVSNVGVGQTEFIMWKSILDRYNPEDDFIVHANGQGASGNTTLLVSVVSS